MSVEDFERKVGAALKDLPPAVHADSGFARRVERAARNRQRRNRMLATGAAGLAVLTLAGVTFAAPWNRDGTVGTATATPMPPPVDQNRAHLVVTPSVVPPSGGEVALIVANPTPNNTVYGVGGTVDRWDGATWQPYGGFTSSLSFWGGAGATTPEQRNPPVRDIGLLAEGRGYGRLEWLAVRDLPEGWYRIGHDTIYGLLEIRSGAEKPPQVRPTGPVFLVTSQTVRAGQATELRPYLTVRDGARPTMRGEVLIEKLVGSRWVALTSVTAQDRPSRIVSNTGEFVVPLPALDRGAHRITRDSTAGRVTGVFWVLP